jgi:FkbM family methyltransferase
MQAASAGCAPVVALEPNPLPFMLAEASLSLNGFGSRVTLLQLAAGDSIGRAQVDRSADADKRWGHASILRLPTQRADQLRARGVGDRHSVAERARAAQGSTEGGEPWEAAREAAERDAAAAADDTVSIVPLSEIAALTKHLLLLKIDTEGGEAEVLAGTWSMWDSGRTVENVVLECKLWNSKPKRDLLRHLARSAGLRYVYTYNEMYDRHRARGRLQLAGRLEDVSSVILNGDYATLLPHEDFWLRREPVPPEFLLQR